MLLTIRYILLYTVTAKQMYAFSMQKIFIYAILRINFNCIPAIGKVGGASDDVVY